MEVSEMSRELNGAAQAAADLQRLQSRVQLEAWAETVLQSYVREFGSPELGARVLAVVGRELRAHAVALRQGMGSLDQMAAIGDALLHCAEQARRKAAAPVQIVGGGT
jgi:hypothetical protein